MRRFFHSTALKLKIKPFLLADIGEGITECEVIQWFVKPGDRVAQFDRICEVQSDKAAVEITSRFDGIITALHYNVGSMARVGTPLVDIDSEEAASEPKAKSAPPTPKPEPVATVKINSAGVLATPAVRRIARENSIDLSKVEASGRDGRVMKEDVLKFIQGGKPQETTAAPKVEKEEKVPLNAIQKAMFKTMSKSLQIPHFGFSEEINMNACKALRESISSTQKITFMPLMLKAMSLALNEHPILNSCLVESDGKPMLQYRHSHNIGVAMDTPNGLLVPNVKNVQSKSVLEIAQELERLKNLGQKGALGTADLSGGTITLSNIGNIGGTVLHPVIVSSEVCIGAVGRIQKLPRFNSNNQVEAHHIMQVSWNADHRVIDGATMARFVSLWKKYLENPAAMLIYLK